MPARTDKKVFWGLALAVVIIAAVGVVFYTSTDLLIADAARVDHTHELINTLTDFLSQLQDVRISSRGYVVSFDPRFLKPHEAATARVHERLRRIRELTSDDPQQQKSFLKLQPMVESKLAESEELIETRKKYGLLLAFQAIQRQMEDDLSDNLRQLISQMVTEENQRLGRRSVEAKFSSRSMLLLVFFASLTETLVAATAALAIRRHISARQRALESLRQSESTLRSFFDSGVVMMGIVEPLKDDIRHLSDNSATARFFGVTPEQMANRTASSLGFPQDVLRLWLDNYEESARCGMPVQFEYFHPQGVGGMWFSAVVCPIASSDASSQRRFSYVVRDITPRKNAEEALKHYADELLLAKNAIEQQARVVASKSEQLELARQQADTANQTKSTFLANMSHEIRTPMSAILGYAEMMLEPDQTASDRQDCLQVIRRSARHLLDLINDILDLSKIEAGRMTLERIPTNPAQVISDVVSMLRPRAQEKGVRLNLDFDGAFAEKIESDPLRFRQVLMNVIGNAIKFTEAGEVSVSSGFGRDERGDFLRVAISDTGIGMAPEQIAHLFQPFCQADATTTRRFGGTGLGLAISRRLVEMLGGALQVDSEVAKGSTFLFSISTGDLTKAHWIHGVTESTFATVIDQPAHDQTTLHARILLAEDGKDNQRLIATHLRKAGAEVVIADNGRIAVDLARASHFDLVLMDMQMPELDGYGAASELRRRGFTMPIIALTAHAMAGDRERCLLAGCTDYLSKPVDKAQLLWSIAGHLGSTTEPPPAPSHEVTPAAAAPTAPLRSDFSSEPQMKDLLDEFVRDLPTHVRQIADLLGMKDLEELRRVVHQLKGAGGGYGFAAITTLAATAEDVIKQSAPLEEVEKSVRELLELIRRVEGYQPLLESVPCRKKS